ncbi:E3 ubiquitin-protein ligase CBL-B-B-like [Hyperolius riggenbachi]|uniref:E3 ubiquitin-protein ligase CBL-B-B-like n=1 Tax=Hyperolius riggenbachi TaxID=752182 RepID=UPI0035A354B4
MLVSHGGGNACLDRRTVERVMLKLDALSRYNATTQLQRSHPYLPDIARDTSHLLRQILDRNLDLTQNQYLQVTVHSLLNKTDECIRALRTMERRNLTKLSLIFSHILCELRVLFPGGRYNGNTYRAAKQEASNFWSQSFGSRCLVRWEEFKEKLHPVHNVEAGPLESALRTTMDLTHNDHISVFEFDIFTRLFQPWETLLQNWMLLAVTHPGYMAFLTYDEVKDLLRGHIHKPGSYIFRLSCTHLGQWAIGYVTSNCGILQTIPQNKSLYEALIDGEKEGLYLYPNGLSCKHDLSSLSNPSTNSVIQVTQEQWDLYSDMDTTFELCKICADNSKDVRIKPCGHLICDGCLTNWQKTDNTCPFCRTKVTGKEKIHIAAPEKPEEHQEQTPNPEAPPDPSLEDCVASAGWAMGKMSVDPYVDEEEVDWIRNRPLPPPPGVPAVPPHHPSASRSSGVFSVPRVPPIPPSRRLRLSAHDIIGGSHH